VAPEAVGLDRRNHPVDDPGEDCPVFVWDHGLERERRDRAQQRSYRLLADALGAQGVGGDGWCVGPEQVRGVDRRIACNDAVQILIQRGEQRDGVATQRVAQRPHGRCVFSLPQPPDDASEVPDSLRAGVQRVHDVAGECPLAAYEAAGIPRTVHGEDGHDQIESELLVQILGLKAEEALVQGAHPYAVDADEPGALLALVAQDPGACRGIASVGEPALPSRLVLVRFVEAVEGEALDLSSLVVDGLDLGFLQGRRVVVVGVRLGEPSLLLEKSVGLRGLALDTDGHRTHRDGPAR
jgi:hypothetical protein